MDKNDQSHFKLSSGSMLNIFLESDIIEQIQKIQKKQNLKDEREVIIHLIQNHYDKIILDTSKSSNIVDNEFPKNIFDGKLDLVKLDKILDIIKSENLIKKLPQHEIYNKSSAGLIHRLHTKILPVKFSLMCLSKMIIEKNNPWIDLNEFKNYTSESAKIFIKKFEATLIQSKFKVKTGFPIVKVNEFKSEDETQLLLARSVKRFTEEFVGRKLQKHQGIQMGGALFEMNLIKAKIVKDENIKKSGNIFVTLSRDGKEFVSYKNQLIDFVFENTQNEPSSIFSQQEREFYLKKILPEFDFEYKFVKNLMKHEVIFHTKDIKEWFKQEFTLFCQTEFPEEHIDLQENSIRIHSNTIMNRLMEFEIFTKDPKSKSGPYTRMQNLGDF